MRNSWLDLVTLCICYGFLGWLLSGYQVSLAVWLTTEIIVAYLAWVGSGAILFSISGSVGIVSAGVMTSGFPDPFIQLPFSLNPAQVWAITYSVSLSWSIFVILKLADTVQRFHLLGWKSLEVFGIAFLIANLGLKLGCILNNSLL